MVRDLLMGGFALLLVLWLAIAPLRLQFAVRRIRSSYGNWRAMTFSSLNLIILAVAVSGMTYAVWIIVRTLVHQTMIVSR